MPVKTELEYYAGLVGHSGTLGDLKREYYKSYLGSDSANYPFGEGEIAYLQKFITTNGGTVGGKNLSELYATAVKVAGGTPTNSLNENKIIFFNLPVTAQTFQLASGSFTGNGTTQSITGLGFQPDLVIIHDDSATAAVRTSWKSTGMTNTASFVGAVANFANGITSLDADGFSVGSANDVNESTKNILWIAFKKASDDTSFTFGSYTGNGTGQSINLGFQPDLVMIKGNTTDRGCWRTSDVAGDSTMIFENQTNITGAITSIDATGFTVGTNSRTNTSAQTYYYFAFKNTTSKFKVLTYTGDSADNRSITGTGFTPKMVWVKGDRTDNAALRLPTNTGDQSYPGFNGVNATNVIQAMESNGFQVGTSQTVNITGTSYYSASWGS